MRTTRHTAFTLPELLIVIAIIGVLAALLMVSMSGAVRLSERTQCAANLHYLYEALQMRRAESAESPLSDVKPRAWPGQLIGYLDYERSVLICPATSAEASIVRDEEPGDPPPPAGDDDHPWHEPYTPEPEGPEHYSELSELIEVKLGNQYIPVEEGPWTIKMSDSQVQAARAKNFLVPKYGYGRNLRQHIDTTYHEDSTPNVYWFCFEDIRPHGGDRDFNDIMMRVTDHNDGSYTLDMNGETGAHHRLVTRPDHEPIGKVLHGGNYQFSVTVGTQEVDTSEGGLWQPEINPYASSADGQASQMVVATNYGMPGETKYLTYRPGAIALMDYGRYVAHSDDCWTDAEVDPNGDGVPMFARHEGHINVLLTDGSVRTMDPPDLNPAYPVNFRKYWLP